MSSVKIDQSFVAHFINGAHGLPIDHENANFDPLTDGVDGNGKMVPYVELELHPNDETPFSLRHSNETDGFFQIVLFYPEGDGAIPAKQLAESILSDFKIGLRLTYQGQRTTVTGTRRLKGVNENGRYILTLRVFYKALINRN